MREGGSIRWPGHDSPTCNIQPETGRRPENEVNRGAENPRTRQASYPLVETLNAHHLTFRAIHHHSLWHREPILTQSCRVITSVAGFPMCGKAPLRSRLDTGASPHRVQPGGFSGFARIARCGAVPVRLLDIRCLY